MHGGRVWNEYDGRAQLIHWTPNQVKEWWDLQSSQVHKRAYQEIWVRRCEDKQKSHDYHNQTW